MVRRLKKKIVISRLDLGDIDGGITAINRVKRVGSRLTWVCLQIFEPADSLHMVQFPLPIKSVPVEQRPNATELMSCSNTITELCLGDLEEDVATWLPYLSVVADVKVRLFFYLISASLLIGLWF